MAKAKDKEPTWEGKPKSEWKYWRTCHCGQEFGTDRANKVNHSDACRNKKQHKHATVPLSERKYTCKYCGKKFTPEQWNQETCPRPEPCAWQHELDQKRKKDREQRAKENKEEIKLTCPECGKFYEPTHGTQVTCGEKKCQDARKSRKAKQKRAEERAAKIATNAEEFDSEKYKREVDPVEQEKKRIKDAADRKNHKAWLKDESQLDILMGAFTDAAKAYPPRATHRLWKPTKKKPEHGLEHAVLIVADPHFGELVRKEDTGDLGDCDIDVLADRIRYAFWKASDMIQNLVRKQGIPVDHLHVMLMGDNVTGEFIYGSQPFNIDVPLEQQAIIGADIMSRGIMSLADYFEKTTVVGMKGNHGEHRKGGRKTKSRTNFDGLFYDALQQRMSLQEDITVIVPKPWWYVHYVNGWGFLLQHKNQGQSSLGSPYYAMDRDEPKMRSLLMNKDQSFFYYVIAHWHHFEHAELAYGERIVAPSIVGTTLFSAEELRKASLPAVLFFGISAKYGQTWNYKIRLDQDVIPKEMQLGAELNWECASCGAKGYGIPDAKSGGKAVCLECAESDLA